jgi:GT2 family glycosyltransferase
MVKDKIGLTVSIIVTNYNGRDLLARNLPSLVKAKENPKNRIIEIIVVDDGSSDDSVKFLKKEFPQVRVIAHTRNRGFAAATNTGVRLAKGKLVCLMNNDVFSSYNFLESTLEIFEKNKKVFGVSLNEGNYGPACGYFENGFIVYKPLPQAKKPKKTFWVSGGSGVFRRDIWAKLGWMDEKLFAPFYWEDVDMSYRALKRGYEVYWDPKAKVVHKHESTIGKFNKKKKERIQERNQLLFIWRNLTSRSLMAKHIAGIFQRVLRHPGYLIIVFMALSKIREVLRLRNKERKENLVADEFILNNFKK